MNDPECATHVEHHSKNGHIVRDSIIGFADGLTVPFALTAGLSNFDSRRLVVVGGLAELFAGAISMGLGAYLAAATEAKHYESEWSRERREVSETPEAEEEEVYEIFRNYGLGREQVKPMLDGLKADEDMWIKFMMDFELKLEKVDPSRAWISALVMGLSYFLGGLIPMVPYFGFHNIHSALFTSIGITGFTLLVFGYIKCTVTGGTKRDAVWSAAQTLAIGSIAAGTSYGIVRGFNEIHSLS